MPPLRGFPRAERELQRHRGHILSLLFTLGLYLCVSGVGGAWQGPGEMSDGTWSRPLPTTAAQNILGMRMEGAAKAPGHTWRANSDLGTSDGCGHDGDSLSVKRLRGGFWRIWRQDETDGWGNATFANAAANTGDGSGRPESTSQRNPSSRSSGLGLRPPAKDKHKVGGRGKSDLQDKDGKDSAKYNKETEIVARNQSSPWCSSQEGSPVWVSTASTGLTLLGIQWYAWLTWGLNIFAVSMIKRYIQKQLCSKRVGVSIYALYGLSVYLHLKTMLTDPGAVPSNVIIHGKKSYCSHCDIAVPSGRTFHCIYCRRCVTRLDHHCAFMNNCVGIRNHKLFLQYLFVTLSAVLMSTYVSWNAFIKKLSFNRIVLKHLACEIVRSPAESFSLFMGSVTILYIFLILNDNLRYVVQDPYSVLGSNPITWFLATVPRFKDSEFLFGYSLPPQKQ